MNSLCTIIYFRRTERATSQNNMNIIVNLPSNLSAGRIAGAKPKWCNLQSVMLLCPLVHKETPSKSKGLGGVVYFADLFSSDRSIGQSTWTALIDTRLRWKSEKMYRFITWGRETSESQLFYRERIFTGKSWGEDKSSHHTGPVISHFSFNKWPPHTT